jgi:hypothetical protein
MDSADVPEACQHYYSRTRQSYCSGPDIAHGHNIGQEVAFKMLPASYLNMAAYLGRFGTERRPPMSAKTPFNRPNCAAHLNKSLD